MWLLCSLSLVAFLPLTLTLPTGAPSSACQDMKPGHSHDPSMESFPYLISISRPDYNSHEQTQVTVTIGTKGGHPFKGFLIQARPVERPDKWVGSFKPVVGLTDTLCQIPEQNASALTHVTRAFKDKIVMEWTSPYTPQGDVQIWVTMVQDFWKHWVKHQGPIIHDVSEEAECKNCKRQSSEALVTDIDLSTCGVSKTCARNHPFCELQDCNFLVTWSNDDEDDSIVNIELRGRMSPGNAWLAFGLSPDNYMTNTSVVECVHNDITDECELRASYNDPGQNSNSVLENYSLGLVPGRFQSLKNDDMMLCRFSKYKSIPNATGSDKGKVFPLDEDFYLILAQGPVSGSKKLYHGFFKVSSMEKVNLASTNYKNIRV